jgi:hypothetical protein
MSKSKLVKPARFDAARKVVSPDLALLVNESHAKTEAILKAKGTAYPC